MSYQVFYQVKSNGDGTYTVIEGEKNVPGAKVRRISFPSNTLHTLHGTTHHIAGLCVATVTIPGLGTFDDVPVIF
jgi:hypothetical protein